MSEFSNRGSLTRRSSSGSTQPPKVTILGLITAIHIESDVNPSESVPRGSSQPSKDYMTIALTHDIPELGLKAEFDESGQPLTLKNISAPLPPNGRSDRLRDIKGLSVKRSGGPAMGLGSLAYFEKGTVAPDGSLNCFCTAGGATREEQQSRLKVGFPSTFTCVLPEGRKKDRDGKFIPSGRQDVIVADTNSAAVITNDEQLLEVVTYYMQGEPDGNGGFSPPTGTPGFLVQVRALAPDTMSDAEKLDFAKNDKTRATASVIAKPNKGDPLPGNTKPTWIPKTVGEVVAELWAKNPEIKAFFGKPGYQFEIIPCLVVPHAKTMVPSNPECKDDTSERYQIIGKAADGTLKPVEQGWRQTHLIVGRMTPESNVWQTWSEHLVSNKTAIYDMPDIPTPAMPAYHLAAVEAQAAVLGQLKRDHYKQENPYQDKGAAPAANAAAPDAEAPAQAPARR